MLKLNFYILFLFIIKLNANESEFLIIKEKKGKSFTVSNYREFIIKKLKNILTHSNLNLDKCSIEIREFALNEIENFFENSDAFLNTSNKQQLKEAFEELNKLEKSIEKSISDINKYLKNLKQKFKSI